MPAKVLWREFDKLESEQRNHLSHRSQSWRVVALRLGVLAISGPKLRRPSGISLDLRWYWSWTNGYVGCVPGARETPFFGKASVVFAIDHGSVVLFHGPFHTVGFAKRTAFAVAVVCDDRPTACGDGSVFFGWNLQMGLGACRQDRKRRLGEATDSDSDL